MKKITVWYSVYRSDTSSLNLYWLLTEEDALNIQREMYYKWDTFEYGRVESFEGSDIHLEAVKNSWKLNTEFDDDFFDETRYIVLDPNTLKIKVFDDYESAEQYGSTIDPINFKKLIDDAYRYWN